MVGSSEPLRGVIAPVFTPFNDDMSIATDLYIAHARDMLDTGCGGIVPFGTAGEGMSLRREERVNTLWALREAGIDPRKMIPGTSLCSYGETADLTRACLDIGCAGVTIQPPFYYKGMPDQGLYDWYARVIDLVGDDLRLYLYNIPQLSGVDLSVSLVRRLKQDFPQQVIGIKDSTGDWQMVKALLKIDGLLVYPNTEHLVLEGMALGAPGCMAATANINAPAIVEMLAAHEAGNTEDAVFLGRYVTTIRDATTRAGLIAVPKAYLALKTGEARWATVRPPHIQASHAAARALQKEIDAAR